MLSPGVPLTHPEPHWSARLASAAGVRDHRRYRVVLPRAGQRIAADAPFVAITGTNGKSTTTALVAHILREAGRDVQMGGNIGTAILSLEPPAENRVHVVEMSSFQIDLTPSLRPSVGVLLNVSPDHLDRHGTMERYAAIKERLVACAETAVIGIDDEMSAAAAARLSLSGRRFSARFRPSRAAELTSFAKGSAWSRRRRAERSPSPTLPASAPCAARTMRRTRRPPTPFARILGLAPRTEIARGMRSFPGLPHRMEEVGRRGPAIFINNSKATNADSTEKALASFERIYWIVGGKAKEGGIEPLRGFFPKIERAYLIGEAADEFAATLEGRVRFERCGTLDRAVARAAEDAAASSAAEPVVLLSPACASYDQYRNFEIRGDHFRELVRALPGVEMNRPLPATGGG